MMRGCQHGHWHWRLSFVNTRHKTLTEQNPSTIEQSYCFISAWMIFPLLTSVRLDASIAQQSLSTEKTLYRKMTDPTSGILRTQENQSIYRRCSDWSASKQSSPSRESKPTLIKDQDRIRNATPLCLRYGITMLPTTNKPWLPFLSTSPSSSIAFLFRLYSSN